MYKLSLIGIVLILLIGCAGGLGTTYQNVSIYDLPPKSEALRIVDANCDVYTSVKDNDFCIKGLKCYPYSELSVKYNQYKGIDWILHGVDVFVPERKYVAAQLRTGKTLTYTSDRTAQYEAEKLLRAFVALGAKQY